MGDRPQFNFLTRPSVAAPVTSMEEAKALPSKANNNLSERLDETNGKSDEPSVSNTIESNNSERHENRPVEVALDTSKNRGTELETVSKSSRGTDCDKTAKELDSIPSDELASQGTPSMNKQTEETGVVTGNDNNVFPDKDLASLPNKNRDTVTIPHSEHGNIELKHSSTSSHDYKLTFEPSQAKPVSPTMGSDSDDVDPLKELSPEQADLIEIPDKSSRNAKSDFTGEATMSPSTDAIRPDEKRSEPAWIIDNDNEKGSEEIPHGASRKHSIAAMKELGTPHSPATDNLSSTPGTPDEDTAFDYPKFMENSRSKSADPIARYIKSFLQEFSRGCWTPAQQEKIVADFLKFISFKLREHEPFASMSKRERRNSMEGVEKLIMTRLYTRTFPPKMPPLLRTDGHNEDLLRDQVFEERMRLWGWVEGRHLDINHEYISRETSQANFIQLATSELSRLHQFKSPRDKMICILNCSKVIFALIRQAKLEQNADSFLPLSIYVVLKSHPVHLISTINYIQRFRNREFQKGETSYYLSTLASAVAFLESSDKSSSTITDEEFEQRMADSVQAESNRIIELQNRQALNEDHSEGHRMPEGESSAAVLTASASMLVERMRKMTSKLWEDLGQDEADPQRITGRESLYRQTRDYRSQARAAARASLDEYENSQVQRQQFHETSEMLQNMFPALDNDLIEDILRQTDSNVGSAVDMCLALGSS